MAEVHPVMAAVMDADRHPGENVPIYRIRTVSALTGIPPRRIRSWETEYELLRPARTKGGRRLYSTREAKLLQDIRRLVEEEGLSLQAVKSWLEAQSKAASLVGGGAQEK